MSTDMWSLRRLSLLFFTLLISNISALVIPGDQPSLDADHSPSAVPPTLQPREQPQPDEDLLPRALRPRAAPRDLAVESEEAGSRGIIDNWWVMDFIQKFDTACTGGCNMNTKFPVDYQKAFKYSHPTKDFEVIVEVLVGEGFELCDLVNGIAWAFLKVNKNTPSEYPDRRQSAPWFGTPGYRLIASSKKGSSGGATPLMQIELTIEVDGQLIEPDDIAGGSDADQNPPASSGGSAPKGYSPAGIASEGQGSVPKSKPKFTFGGARTQKVLSNLRCPRKNKSQYSSFGRR